MVHSSHGGGSGGDGRVIIYYQTATVNITFNANMPQEDWKMNDAIPASTTITYGSTFGDKLDWRDPSLKNRVGYDFKGWFDNAAGSGNEITSTTPSSFTSDATLYAKWQPKRMKVTFNLNGGQWASGHSNSTTVYNVDYGTSYRDQMSGFDWTIPVREGWVFMGWNTNNSGTGLTYGPDAHVGQVTDHTLYAYWVKEEMLPPSVVVCYEGTSSLCGSSGYTGYHWSPSTGLSGTNAQCVELNSSNMSSDNVTYTLTYAKGNIANFDFSGGNVGFSSDYEIREDEASVPDELWSERVVSVTDCWGHVHQSLDVLLRAMKATRQAVESSSQLMEGRSSMQWSMSRPWL